MARIEVATVQPPADGWVPLGGIVVDSPAATTPAPGRLDVVVRGVDDQLWHKWFDAGSWSGWEALGGLTTAGPATTVVSGIGSTSSSTASTASSGTSGGTAPGPTGCHWAASSWTRPAAASWGPGRLDVVVRGVDDQLWHKWFDAGSWSGWEPLGGLTTAGPATTSWSAGRLDVFVNGIDGQLWHKWWDGAWSDWVPLGGIVLDSPAATTPGIRASRCRRQRHRRPAVAQVVRRRQLVRVGGLGRPHHRGAGGDELVSGSARRLRQRHRRPALAQVVDGAWSDSGALGRPRRRLAGGGTLGVRHVSMSSSEASTASRGTSGSTPGGWSGWEAVGRPHHRGAGRTTSSSAGRLEDLRDRRRRRAGEVVDVGRSCCTPARTELRTSAQPT